MVHVYTLSQKKLNRFMQTAFCSFVSSWRTLARRPSVTCIQTLLRLPSTGLFSHNVNYYIILVIKKRKENLFIVVQLNSKIHSKLFKIYSNLFRMKYPIKKSPLKTINIFSVPNIVSWPISFLWTPKIKLPLSHW